MGPSPATTSEREAASAQLVQPAHSAARSAIRRERQWRQPQPPPQQPPPPPTPGAGGAVAADRARRERREQLRDLAGGALRAGDERAVARDELLEAMLARTARVLVDRHARIVSRAAGALPRDVARMGAGLHPPEGYRTDICRSNRHRARARPWRARCPSSRAALAGRDDVALVPTMGALHEGHRALLRAARRSAATVVMSLFVNPAQFGPGEDFARYPRDEARRRRHRRRGGRRRRLRARRRRRSIPRASRRPSIRARWRTSSRAGARPGHFRGVATVVTRLFGLVRPQRAFFGEKDFQQLVIVRGVARDLALGVEVVGVPTVRDADGLALSSRNRYLSAGERGARDVAVRRACAPPGELYAGGERDAGLLRGGRAPPRSPSSPSTSSCGGATTSAPTTRLNPPSCSSPPSSARRA